MGYRRSFRWREYVIDGGLLSYEPSQLVSRNGWLRRAHSQWCQNDRPVQQPSTFELVLNLNAAKALALTIPTSILLRADEVIE
jgi:putative tryptophan/tyrosine transport system substrate-binding protein